MYSVLDIFTSVWIYEKFAQRQPWFCDVIKLEIFDNVKRLFFFDIGLSN